ncbi:hypothetical protein [Brevundimonas faecalis]|uniref:TIR domain-containing protein n=1 Tax=Brevundimonas faecalis TaxID=947378 RepID=A0ABV2R6T6_9CAUL
MAEILTPPRRTCAIIYSPFPNAMTWRAQLDQSAASNGWIVCDASTLSAEQSATHGMLVTCENIEQALSYATKIFIVSASPNHCVEYLETAASIQPMYAVQWTSRHFSSLHEQLDVSWTTLDPYKNYAPEETELSFPIQSLAPTEVSSHELLDMFRILPVPAGSQFDWPVRAFFPEPQDCDEFQPLTGRRRCLTFGPNIVLPRGLWQLEFDLELRTDHDPVLFSIDWASLDEADSGKHFSLASGRHHVSLTRHWKSGEVNTLRLTLERPRIDGWYRLGDIKATYMADG